MDRAALLNDLIGKPWSPNGKGPDEFSCLGLVRYVGERLFGLSIPDVELPDGRDDAARFREYVRLLTTHPEMANWQPFNGLVPPDGTLVLMSMAQRPAHIGLFLTDQHGVIIHCDEAQGGMLESPSAARARGWGRQQFMVRRIDQ